jgi:hypothetical protein
MGKLKAETFEQGHNLTIKTGLTISQIYIKDLKLGFHCIFVVV